MPPCVCTGMSNYMQDSYVQLGAGYELSKIATDTVHSAHVWTEVIMNGTRRAHPLASLSGRRC